MDYLVIGFLAASAALNLLLSYRLFKKDRVLTIDAKRLLHEITSGGAVIRLEVLDASQLFLRSPRG